MKPVAASLAQPLGLPRLMISYQRMPLQIHFSDCKSPASEAEIRRRAEEVFKQVPDQWDVRITANSDGSRWRMNISGPGHFWYELDLGRDAGEHTPDFVISAIKQAVVGELSG